MRDRPLGNDQSLGQLRDGRYDVVVDTHNFDDGRGLTAQIANTAIIAELVSSRSFIDTFPWSAVEVLVAYVHAGPENVLSSPKREAEIVMEWLRDQAHLRPR